jgi:hypothetical protein
MQSMEKAHDQRNTHRPNRAGTACRRRYHRFDSCVPGCDGGWLASRADAFEHTEDRKPGSKRPSRLAAEAGVTGIGRPGSCGCCEAGTVRTVCGNRTRDAGRLARGASAVASPPAQKKAADGALAQRMRVRPVKMPGDSKFAVAFARDGERDLWAASLILRQMHARRSCRTAHGVVR